MNTAYEKDCCIVDNMHTEHKAQLIDSLGTIHEMSFSYCTICGNFTLTDVE